MPLETLTYGFEKATLPTTADVWMPAFERNWQKVNDHTHNGVNSAQIANTTATVSSASWGSDLGGGRYRQLITLPGTMQFDSTRIEVRRSTGQMAYPTIEKVSATTFYIYTNDNSVSYILNYL
jgi:hypothetical protein